MRAFIAFFSLLSMFFTGSTFAQDLPPNARHTSIAEFGAVPNDGIDDRESILAAARKWPGKDTTVVFPCGRYDATGPLAFKTLSDSWIIRTTIRAERAGCAEIVLADNSPGFQDVANPQSFLSLGEGGNQSFQVNIIGVNIRCGNNRGARCVDFIGHNQAQISESEMSGGGTVLYLGRAWPGPLLVRESRVLGGRIGVEIKHPQYGITLRNVRISGQTVAGVDFGENALFADEIEIDESANPNVPAIRTSSPSGFLVLANSDLTGSGGPAIDVPAGGHFMLSSVESFGYTSTVRRGGVALASGLVEALSSEPARGQLRSLGRAAPVPERPDCTGRWASVIDYGAAPGEPGGETTEDTTGINAALRSGLPCVHLPRKSTGDRGRYTFRGATVSIPRTVQVLDLAGNEFSIVSSAYQFSDKCVISIEEGTAEDPPLFIDYFRRASGQHVFPGHYFCHTSARRVVFTRATSANWLGNGPGTLWALDNIVQLDSINGYSAELFQHNTEGVSPVGTTRVYGSYVRDFGSKSEKNFKQYDVQNGQLIAVGFFMPAVGQNGVPVSANGIEAIDSTITTSFVQYSSGVEDLNKVFPQAVVSTVNGVTVTIPTSSTYSRGPSVNRWTLPAFGTP